MNCPVCVLLLRALRGSGGESENYVTEMTASGIEAQFLLSCERGEDSEGGGGRGCFGCAMRKMRSIGRCPHVVPGSVMWAYAYVHRGYREGHTYTRSSSWE